MRVPLTKVCGSRLVSALRQSFPDLQIAEAKPDRAEVDGERGTSEQGLADVMKLPDAPRETKLAEVKHRLRMARERQV